jgi:hypothetical protein
MALSRDRTFARSTFGLLGMATRHALNGLLKQIVAIGRQALGMTVRINIGKTVQRKPQKKYVQGETMRPRLEVSGLWRKSPSSQGLRTTVLPASFRIPVPSESVAISARNA